MGVGIKFGPGLLCCSGHDGLQVAAHHALFRNGERGLGRGFGKPRISWQLIIVCNSQADIGNAECELVAVLHVMACLVPCQSRIGSASHASWASVSE